MKEYPLSIHNWSEAYRPREKLLKINEHVLGTPNCRLRTFDYIIIGENAYLSFAGEWLMKGFEIEFRK
jgi:DNA repair protein RadC